MALPASVRFVSPNAEAMLGASWSKLLPYSNFVLHCCRASSDQLHLRAEPHSILVVFVDVVNSIGLTHTA